MTPTTTRRARARRAVVGVVLALAVVLAACGDDDADDRAATTTSTTGPSTTTSTARSTTTTNDAEPSAPRPERWVGITDDGRLVVVDSDSGDETRVLGEFDHPEECPEPGEPVAGCQWLAEVAVSPDGRHVYYETCCEPAPGIIHRVPIDGGEPEMVTHGAFPALDASNERLAVVELQWVTVHELVGEGDVRTFQDDAMPAVVHGLTWSPDGTLLAFTVFERTDGPGRLHVLDVDDADTLGDARTIEPADPASSWTLPTFRRDGTLVVAEQELELPDGPQGPARALVVDPDSGEVLERHGRSDAVASQHHDASGTHLLYVLTDGSVRWGLDGADDGAVLADGGYLAAAW